MSEVEKLSKIIKKRIRDLAEERNNMIIKIEADNRDPWEKEEKYWSEIADKIYANSSRIQALRWVSRKIEELKADPRTEPKVARDE